MKRNVFLLFVLCAVLVMAGCKSKESAYKQAYEKAKAAETSDDEDDMSDVAVVTPMEEAPVETTVVVSNDDSEQFRTEELSIVDGDALRAYSVVVGSFALKANAEGLENTLQAQGYAARLAYNADRNMYRVVATSFDTRGEAIASRDMLRNTYPDAWLLYQQ